MSRRANAGTHVVRDGVFLKKTTMSPFYYYYFRLHNHTFRASTETAHLQTAENIALEAYYDIKKSGAIAKQKKASFSQLAESFLKTIAHEHKHGFYSLVAKSCFIPFFSKNKDIRDITTSDMVDYLLWRKDKGKKVPKPQTVNKENVVLHQMLLYAFRKNYINKIPEIPRQDERKSFFRRRHFTLQEYRTLIRVATQRIKEVSDNPLLTVHKWRRQLLKDYIIVLISTGLRVDESKTLIWRNVDLENSRIKLENAGKVKSSRVLYVRPSGVVALKRIKQRRLEHIPRHKPVVPIEPQDPVFAIQDGKDLGSTKKSFVELLKACPFVYKNADEKHTLTSLRHSYATFSLTRKGHKKISMRTLSIQMGTSLSMLEAHYAHDSIEDYRGEILG